LFGRLRLAGVHFPSILASIYSRSAFIFQHLDCLLHLLSIMS
jgi:hypothetical protein